MRVEGGVRRNQKNIDKPFLTRLGESGCDAWTLARISGRSSVAISERYVHPSEDRMLEAISRLGGHKIGHSEREQLSASDGKLLTTSVI
jgi:hypothetical protein